MRSILEAIVANKKQEIASLPSIDPQLQAHRSLIAAVVQGQPGLIAEIKPMSPSAGQIISRPHVPEFIQLYQKYAQAISVLCDTIFFGGGFDLLKNVRDQTETPILAKEFILDEKQIDYAAHNGASAILLIVSILPEERLIQLATHASSLNLDILIETHDMPEAERAASVFLQLPRSIQERAMVGINNRNLHTTAKPNLAVTETVAPFLQQELPTLSCRIAESGIHTRADINRLLPYVNGFLIGESILMAQDPEAHLVSLAGRTN